MAESNKKENGGGFGLKQLDYEIQKTQLVGELKRIQQLLKDKTEQNTQLQPNYNALLEKLTNLAPDVNAAIKKALQESQPLFEDALKKALENLNIAKDIKDIKEEVDKIDNEALKKIITEKTQSIEPKIDNISIPELPKPPDVDLSELLKEVQETR
ncbi:23092_t:CDS:1 [Racocetra persica]|uniref:23092_t:CDS:1 n=1 Tax=Racocetra persica TaxID=160502 RepID=A0ACA9RG55_9GLOM|nr:23092_t:CDS:1 [Racocetra persica]